MKALEPPAPLLDAAGPGVQWGLCIREVGSGDVLAGIGADVPLPTASVGKVFLLVELARAAAAGERPLDVRLARTAEDAVGDSGLWQHLAAESLSAGDLAVLVGAVSDNVATNVLLRHVGLEAVQATTRRLGFHHSALHDRVREHRTPEHAPTLSTGTAAELSRLFALLAARRLVSPAVSEQVLAWLAPSADLSMVASALGLDPLAHVRADRSLLLRHKTGTDPGVRAEAGVLEGRARGCAYAVCARWDDARAHRRDAVLDAMRDVGRSLREVVSAD